MTAREKNWAHFLQKRNQNIRIESTQIGPKPSPNTSMHSPSCSCMHPWFGRRTFSRARFGMVSVRIQGCRFLPALQGALAGPDGYTRTVGSTTGCDLHARELLLIVVSPLDLKNSPCSVDLK